MLAVEPLEGAGIPGPGTLNRARLPNRPVIPAALPLSFVGLEANGRQKRLKRRSGELSRRRGPARPRPQGGVLRLAYQLMAYCRSWALVARLSLRFRLCRWVSTVFTDNPRASAASREDRPAADQAQDLQLPVAEPVDRDPLPSPADPLPPSIRPRLPASDSLRYVSPTSTLRRAISSWSEAACFIM